MLLGVPFVAALLSVVLCGGRLSALGEVRLRGTWIVFSALAVQIVIISVIPGGGGWVHQAIHLSTYGMVGVFAWLNRRVPGLAVASAGGLSNFAAIAANGGVMPASPSALRTAGLEPDPGAFENSAALEDPRLAWLGDVFALPAHWPVSNVFSIGDVLLVVGIFAGLHVICRTRPARAIARLRRSGAPAAVATPRGDRP